MQSASSSLWGSRLATLVLWALAAGSVTYWVLKWPVAGQGMVNAPLPPVDVAQPTVQAVAKALGGGQTAVAAPGGPAMAQVAQASSRMALVDGDYAKAATEIVLDKFDPNAPPIVPSDEKGFFGRMLESVGF